MIFGSPVLGHLSSLICPASAVLDHMSWVTCPGSPVLGHLSWITCAGLFILGSATVAEAFRYSKGHLSWFVVPHIVSVAFLFFFYACTAFILDYMFMWVSHRSSNFLSLFPKLSLLNGVLTSTEKKYQSDFQPLRYDSVPAVFPPLPRTGDPSHTGLSSKSANPLWPHHPCLGSPRV